MIWQKPHGPESKDKVFLNCEYADTAGTVRGALLMWDTSATAASEGVLGLRVIRTTATATLVSVAGVLETSAVDAQPAANAGGGVRGQMVLVQCYGYHDGVLVTGGVTAAGAGFIQSNSIVPGIAAIDASVTTTAEVLGTFGFNAEAYDGSASSVGVFLKAM